MIPSSLRCSTAAAVALSFLSFLPAYSEEKKDKKESEVFTVESASREDSVTIDGTEIQYQVTASSLALHADTNKAEQEASIFSVAYTVPREEGAEGPNPRPVLFAFNGGPGSSAVWLHLGALGPKLVPTSPDGTKTLPPPIVLEENPHSILDVADLVFIDPVSTGYSRPSNDKKNSYHGLEGDIESVGNFIRLWLTQNQRWSSPKYLLGESYGGVRAAGLSEHLQKRYGMSLNGVVLLSSLLDFRTLIASQGDYLSNQVYLPVMTAVAHHHGKIEGDRDELYQAARDYANTEFALALQEGALLSPEKLDTVSNRLAELTGVPAKIWKETNLRLSPTRFRRELLREEGLVLGRFDARVAWPAQDTSGNYPSYDPSYSVALGAFSTSMQAYLSEDLGLTDINTSYRILTQKVRPWSWNSSNSVVNLTGRLQSAMTDNPQLRILVMGGYTDFATPPTGIGYSLNQLVSLPESSRDRISYTYYEAGHMFYLNEPDLAKMRTDLLEFIK